MTPNGAGSPEDSFGTNGAMARRRARRIAVLCVLAILLALLSYGAYYYTQNRRLPIPEIVADNAKMAPPQHLYSFSGTGAQSMDKPTGIAIRGQRVYVTDFFARTVRAYSLDGDYLFGFGAIKDGDATSLDNPVHIAIGPDDTVWVTDRGLRAVYVFDPNGKFVRKFAPDKDPKFDWAPLAIAFSPEGDLFVTDVGDSEKHRVLAFAKDGTIKAEWGSTAPVAKATDSPGSFLFPNGLAITGTGAGTLVYVADGNNRRVQVFRADGSFVRIINTSGTPRGLAADAEGRVWVVDALAHRVDLYSGSGATFATFGENGTGPGQFQFPNDVALDARGWIFVTDHENNQVQVWGFPVAEIPGVTRITPGSAWLLLIPLPLLLIPLLFRRRRFVATPDFVDGMIVADLVPQMVNRSWRWVMTESDGGAYEGRSSGGVDLGELLHPEPYSESDAGAIRARMPITMEAAGRLAMAKRYRTLCTDDLELAKLAATLEIDVYDRASWLEHFRKDRS